MQCVRSEIKDFWTGGYIEKWRRGLLIVEADSSRQVDLPYLAVYKNTNPLGRESHAPRRLWQGYGRHYFWHLLRPRGHRGCHQLPLQENRGSETVRLELELHCISEEFLHRLLPLSHGRLAAGTLCVQTVWILWVPRRPGIKLELLFNCISFSIPKTPVFSYVIRNRLEIVLSGWLCVTRSG